MNYPKKRTLKYTVLCLSLITLVSCKAVSSQVLPNVTDDIASSSRLAQDQYLEESNLAVIEREQDIQRDIDEIVAREKERRALEHRSMSPLDNTVAPITSDPETPAEPVIPTGNNPEPVKPGVPEKPGKDPVKPDASPEKPEKPSADPEKPVDPVKPEEAPEKPAAGTEKPESDPEKPVDSKKPEEPVFVIIPEPELTLVIIQPAEF